jgi:hypothetical protein
VLAGADAQTIATYLWAVSHGVVSLAISGKLTVDEEKAYGDAMVYSVLPFRP